ncbi:MAG: formate--phosphoribosylaminoimidazolecarboxamide ligase [Candidatus Aenigmarchaeota archaeon]|nr:formate--phosphoribosylaminoimidazolecarboxamide ligase [Candidatus Aenigmarchaeota archaeon]
MVVERDDISEILKDYDKSEITIGTIGSHSALQILSGAKKEGFKTLNMVTKERKEVYNAYPLARPDYSLEVKSYKEILDKDFQLKLTEKNVVIIPHGSFVEYVGAENILNDFHVPIFGNRESLVWEADRSKQREWLEGKAGLKMPREFKIDEINNLSIVKLHGAKGGKGFARARNPKEVSESLEYMKEKGLISEEDLQGDLTVQEYIDGARYYLHYFLSKFSDDFGVPVYHRGRRLGNLLLSSIDRRDETNIDDIHRTGLNPEELKEVGIVPTYTVAGNIPLVARESLLPKIYKMGEKTVEASDDLFPPGINGPFCLETFCRPNLDFVVFEISGRIVAGTNLYISGSPYLDMVEEGLSTGRLIAREIKKGIEKDKLDEIIY